MSIVCCHFACDPVMMHSRPEMQETCCFRAEVTGYQPATVRHSRLWKVSNHCADMLEHAFSELTDVILDREQPDCGTALQLAQPAIKASPPYHAIDCLLHGTALCILPQCQHTQRRAQSLVPSIRRRRRPQQIFLQGTCSCNDAVQSTAPCYKYGPEKRRCSNVGQRRGPP